MTSRGPIPSMAMTSLPKSQGTSSHPRRPPAKQSVSLLHSPKPPPTRAHKQTNASTSDSEQKRSPAGDSSAADSPSSLQALGGRGSSGETSNAENWFDKSNNEVRENSAPFADNDTPFFMRNSSSSQTPPDLRQQLTNNNKNSAVDSLPLHTGLLQLGTDGGSTEDFRGVIDDLTIQNKKLKRRLKKYEKLHDSHLKDEKLFEVRIHGLPVEKKRELEDTLRKFASSLGQSGANAFPPDGYASLMPIMKGAKATSSQVSLQHADSAYASMSASGQGSAAQSGNDGKHKMTPSQNPAVRRQNIHNYLHHIPEGLLPPQSPATMSERAKKKLVVRRMEQIFAGKGAADVGHQHSIQQQEVSHSAARTYSSGMEAAGRGTRKEGSREAHIMNHETEDPLDARQEEKLPLEEPIVLPPQPKETNVGQQGLAEQRPTRPLDLDPHRAQVPAENIRYLRQMGFSPADPQWAEPAEDGHGWIYLNFLNNMAQLHTINVTDSFVRKALSEYSEKFELSNDGRKVRWKGGNNVTASSSSGGGSSNDRTSDNTPDRQSPRKRLKLSHNNSTHQAGGASGRWQSETSKYAYTPLFFHREDSEETDDSSSEEEDNDDTSSPFPPPMAGDSSGKTTSGIHTSSGVPLAAPKKKQKHDDGPIIYYNNARFCTDLSGDRNSHVNYNPPIYIAASDIPIGKEPTAVDGSDEKRGPLAEASELPEPMDLSDNPIPDHMELSFPQRSSPRLHSSKEQKPIDLEVTGIGGVWPADNLSISVESRHARVEQGQAPGVPVSSASKAIPQRFANILRSTKAEPNVSQIVQEEVIASKVRELAPSQLPPAVSFMPFGEESEDDDQSDADEDRSEVPESPGAIPPSTAPQPVDISFASSDEDSQEEDSDNDEESDGEVDFLAGVRQLDPEAVRQKEREYDANMAERLAEEIPAGSSAATAGGGSGFASPASDVDLEEYQQAMQQAHRKSAVSKTAKAPERDSSSGGSR